MVGRGHLVQIRQAIASQRLVGRSKLAILGPGLLFAATSVGTSHLVQSTRAGALYGLALLSAIILVNLLKYPAFRFASDYFPATGTSILEAYRRQGKVVLVVFAAITLTTLLFAVSVLALMSAGLLAVVLNTTFSIKFLALGLIVVTAAILIYGHYRALERISKVLVALMAVGTLILTAVAVPGLSSNVTFELVPTGLDYAGLMFVAALIGWMPIPLDASVWQSLWAKANAESHGSRNTMAESRFDFNLGFFGTIALAICFLIIGATLVHEQGLELPPDAQGLSTQLIDLYTKVFGPFAKQIVGMLAFAVIFSSLLTAMDAFPRTLSSLFRRLKGIDERNDTHILTETSPSYIGTIIGMIIGAVLTYRYFLTSVTALVDLAATVAFVVAPVIAYLNHRAITSITVPAEHRPGKLFRRYSAFCILALSAFAIGYLYLRFVYQS